MIIVPKIALQDLMTHIVQSTHELCDENGEPRIMSTIMESQLRIAAVVALQIATGEAIWPGDKIIQIKRPRIRQGIFQEEER
jgi:hypothetical protein